MYNRKQKYSRNYNDKQRIKNQKHLYKTNKRKKIDTSGVEEYRLKSTNTKYNKLVKVLGPKAYSDITKRLLAEHKEITCTQVGDESLTNNTICFVPTNCVCKKESLESAMQILLSTPEGVAFLSAIVGVTGSICLCAIIVACGVYFCKQINKKDDKKIEYYLEYPGGLYVKYPMFEKRKRDSSLTSDGTEEGYDDSSEDDY
jgi:hypothetical protein